MNIGFLRSLFKPSKIKIPLYEPGRMMAPKKKLEINSGWKGLELIIPDIIDHFQIKTNKCIEFGVEFGYSAVIFSNYFNHVIGIDTFEGDVHTMHKGDHFDQAKENLKIYPNIELIKENYQNWIKTDENYYDLAHVDIVHTYKDTYKCGLWAVKNSQCALFHDTESFIEVRRAVYDIAKETGKSVYNYPHCNGLGIIV